MQEITIACVQFQPQLNEPEDNIMKMAAIVRDIGTKQRTDLVIFPELATTGFENGLHFTELAQRVPGPAVNVMAKRAADFNTHILFGLPTKQKVESVIYNSAVMVGPDGDVFGEYRKVHLRGEERLPFREGFKYRIFETGFGLVGVMLGYELYYPEVARSLALEGADLICCLANWEQSQMREWRALSVARAIENNVPIAAVNRCGEDVTLTFGGDTAVISARGEVLDALPTPVDEETGEIGQATEGYIITKLDLDDLRQAREETQNFQARRPETYRAVVKRY